jgi:hypothetical protein
VDKFFQMRKPHAIQRPFQPKISVSLAGDGTFEAHLHQVMVLPGKNQTK